MIGTDIISGIFFLSWNFFLEKLNGTGFWASEKISSYTLNSWFVKVSLLRFTSASVSKINKNCKRLHWFFLKRINIKCLRFLLSVFSAIVVHLTTFPEIGEETYFTSAVKFRRLSSCIAIDYCNYVSLHQLPLFITWASWASDLQSSADLDSS